MIRLDQVTVTYPGQPTPTLLDVDITLPEGELALVAGPTGSGKSTLLGLVNGLVPHFTGGHLAGSVSVDGLDTRHHPPRELAHLVGVVGQDPQAGFVTDTVEEELAYGMEQLGTPPALMRRRVEDTLDLLGIAELRRRPLRTLSGGQQQRVAMASVLAPNPRVLVLDEPTSALDPAAAEEVLAAVTRLVHDLGVTAIVSEHRLERVVQYADSLLLLTGDATVRHGQPATLLATAASVPPVVRLGRLAGWEPLPLSVRDARRAAGPMRDRLARSSSPARQPVARGAPTLTAAGVSVRYERTIAVRDVSLTLDGCQVTALMGRNGSGKSSLLWALQGSGPRHAGTVDVAGVDPRAVTRSRARRLVGLVPQSATDLLYLETVADECAQADAESGATDGTTRRLLERLLPDVNPRLHPRDLSEGQRLAVALSVQLAAAPRVLLLDEPTRGLDYGAKRSFGELLRELAAEGRSVVLATHDVELVAEVADRVVLMAEGEVVTDGAVGPVLTGSPALAPQVARILTPGPWLTVDDVALALGPQVSQGSR